jgi:hypothetical protein
MLDWQRSVALGGLGASSAPNFATFPWETVVLPLLATLIVGPLTIIGGAAMIDAVATTLGGGRPGVRRSYAAAIARLRDLLLVFVVLIASGLTLSLFSLVFPLIASLGRGGIGLSGPGLFAALIVGVAVVFAVAFITIRLTFTLQALMLESKPAAGALRRSWDVAGGSMLRIIGWAIVFALLVGLLGLLFEVVAGIVAFIVAPPRLTTLTFALSPTFLFTFSFLTAVGAAIVAPIAAIGLTLLYLDIRWRRGEQVLTPGVPQASPTDPSPG